MVVVCVSLPLAYVSLYANCSLNCSDNELTSLPEFVVTMPKLNA